MRSRSVVVTVLAGAAALLAVPAQAAGPGPTPVTECGQQVTGSAYLAQDLTCAEVGVTVLGGGTLDLRGRTISGPGAAQGGTGVALGGDGSAEVRNGRITGFYNGVYAYGPGTKTVRSVTAEDNSHGVAAFGDMFEENPADLRIVRSTLQGNIDGVSTAWLHRVEITRSTIADNNWGAQFAWAGVAVVSTTTVEGNSSGLLCGVTCTITGSTFTGNEYEGVFQDGGELDLSSSVLSDNGTGYQGGMSVARLTGNTFTSNGVGVVGGFELDLRLERSTFRDNGTGYTTDSDGGPVDTLVRNTFVHNGDAIVSDAAELALGRNTANANSGWGIHAPNATDLGGNRAAGNGNDPQCVGVVCQGS